MFVKYSLGNIVLFQSTYRGQQYAKVTKKRKKIKYGQNGWEGYFVDKNGDKDDKLKAHELFIWGFDYQILDVV